VAAAPTRNASEAMIKVSQTAEAASPSDVYPAGMELVFDGQVIRDPRLDRYLLAHKQFAGTSVLGPTSGLLRNAAVEVPER
jgi:sigma-E factor negative regulatory protein RseA